MPQSTLTANFSELFQYAEEEFGIHWNRSCDLFHSSELLNYSGTTDVYLFDTAMCVYTTWRDGDACKTTPFYVDYDICGEWDDKQLFEWIMGWDKELVKKEPDDKIGKLVLSHWMASEKITEVMILGD